MSDCPLCRDVAATVDDPDRVVARLPHALVLLGPWQAYYGYCVVVSTDHVRELHDLADVTGYVDDVCRVSRAVEVVARPRKLNVEMLGNVVPHLHCHVFPRFESDPAKLQAVWLALAEADRDPAAKERLQTGPEPRAVTIAKLRAALGVV